jgi:sorbitol/mannitol transport system permease protein
MSALNASRKAAKTSKKIKLGERELSRLRVSRALIWPALTIGIIISQIPFLVTIYYSLQNWNLLRPLEQGFVGLNNYIEIFQDGILVESLLSTVIITGSAVALSLVAGLGLALLLDRKFIGQSVARTLLITPFLVMPAASALIWKYSILEANSGIMNWFLSLFGVGKLEWTTELPVQMIIMVLTWQYMPFMMLILLAGLQSQSQEVLEAASVDGAGPFRRFVTMTIPHLRQYVEIAVLLGSILLFAAFDPIAIMTKGAGGTTTLPWLLYERAFIGLEVGQAAAYGVVSVILTMIFASILLRTLFKIFSVKEDLR